MSSVLSGFGCSSPVVRSQYGRTIKRACLLVDLARAQDDVEEQDAEEKLGVTTLQDPVTCWRNDEDWEWRHQRPSHKATVHQFVGGGS
jgi:hypothetical protein